MLKRGSTERPTAEELLNLYNGLFILWIAGEAINMGTLSDFKLGDKVAVDTHHHILILSNSQMRQYSCLRWICSISEIKEKNSAILIILLHFIAINVNMISALNAF